MFDPRLTRPHFKSVIFASYFELLKDKYPHVDIKTLIEEAGLSIDYISDENSWVSVTAEKIIMDLIVEKTKNRNIFLMAGQSGISRTGLGTAIYFLASNIIPLDSIYKSLPKMTGLLNKVIAVEVAESKNGYFKFIFKPNLADLDEEEAELLISRMPLVMENTKGYYSSFPTIKNLPPAQTKIDLLDDKTGTYSIEVTYFSKSKIVGQLATLLPLTVGLLLTWMFKNYLNIDTMGASFISCSVVATFLSAYFYIKTRKLKGFSIQTEESLFRLDRQYKDLYDAKSQLQRKLEESQANFHLVSHLISAVMEEEVLQLGCESLVENLNYDRAFILLYDKKQNCLKLAASKGLTPAFKESILGLAIPADIDDNDPAKFTNVFKTKKALLVKDVGQHILKLKDPKSLQILQGSGSRSFVAASISTQSSSIGILVTDCISRRKIMTEDDLRIVTTAAQQIAIAIEQQRSKQELVDSYQKEIELSVSYSRFVPFETLKLLNYENIVDVKLGDYVEENVAIMFSDIRGFTTLCENMTPKDILRFLNSYYARLSPIIKSFEGTIDKFMGDGVMAIFPSAELALNAAIEIQRAILRYNLQHRVGHRTPVKAGVGLAAGKVVFGPLGSEKRLELTAISDTVNIASRLDGLCRSEGEDIMFTGFDENTLEKFPQLSFKRYQPLKVKGRSADLDVISVLDGNLFDGIDQTHFSSSQLNYLNAQISLWQNKLDASKNIESAKKIA